MTKLRKIQIDDELDDDFIWDDYMCDWYYEYYEQDEEIWWDQDAYNNRDLSWQWYMERSIRLNEGWFYVVIDKQHKEETVKNWIDENYPDTLYKYERGHFLIQDQGVATMVTLKWT